VKRHLGMLLSVCAFCLAGCTAANLFGGGVPTQLSDRTSESGHVATARTYLYWLPLFDRVLKYQLGNKRSSNYPYGEGHGTGIAVDTLGNVHQSWGYSDSAAGIIVLDKKLTTTLGTINLTYGIETVAITVDAAGEQYLLDGNENAPPDRVAEIEAFPNGVFGSPKPDRVISGQRTHLQYVGVGGGAIVVDQKGYLYVANAAPFSGETSSVLVFAPGAKGDVAPVRQLVGPKTGITNAVNLALGADGNLYVQNHGYPTSQVLVFPTSASGNVAPRRILQATTYSGGMALGTGGELYLGSSATEDKNGVAVFAPGASGNATPTAYLPVNTNVAPPNFLALSDPWFQP
jgi:hypothetical protein